MKNSYKTIDINNISESISTIEGVLSEDIYEKNIDSLVESKSKVLNEYNFVNRIKEIINNKTVDTKDAYIDSIKKYKLFLEKQHSCKTKN